LRVEIGAWRVVRFLAQRQRRGRGWRLDEGRPMLTLANPQGGVKSRAVDRITAGMHDDLTGLDVRSLRLTADFEVDGAAGENLASMFNQAAGGVRGLKLPSRSDCS
jgi:hypothetical protein